MEFFHSLFDLAEVPRTLLLIALAYLLALPMALDREKSTRVMGLRSFPLVAVASCGFILLADQAFPESPDAQARALQGVITGMGFIGGGAILKNNGHVEGTATAVSIWITGAVGATVALGRVDIALTLSLVTYLTLTFMGGIKREMNRNRDSGRNETDPER